MSNTLYFGETTFHRRFARLGIKQADRLLHTYALGATGVGKSTLLEILAKGDLAAGRGFTLIDPHGDLVERVWAAVSEEHRERVTYLDVANPTQPFGYNPLRRVREDKIPLAVSGLLETMRKLWPLAWGVRMEHVLRNTLYALLEVEGSTLNDALLLYADQDYRRAVTARVRNPVVRAYWRDEFEKTPPLVRAQAISPIQNKLGALLSDPTLYRVLVEPKVDIRFRGLMDEGRVLLVNLAKGRIGEDAATLLGGFLISTLGLAAYSRAELPPEQRVPHIIYADEFQTFTTLAFVNMLSEIRKGGVGMVLANQYLAALEPEIRSAVLGNAGTLIAFRSGPEDAGILAREFQPVFGVEDVLNLPNRHFYLRLMIDGTPSRPFSGRTVGR
jgi:hypothetical protein